MRDPGRKPARPCPEPAFYNQGKQDKSGQPGGKNPLRWNCWKKQGLTAAPPSVFGFPLPLGGIFSPDRLRVVDPAGREVPAQFSITGFWPDQSLKWVLIQFTAPLKAKEKAVYRVEAGNEVRRNTVASPLKLTKKGADYHIETGSLTALIKPDLSVDIAGRGVLATAPADG